MAKGFLEGRNQGMSFALRVAERNGVEGLRQEIKARGIMNIPLEHSLKEVNEFAQRVREDTFNAVMVMAFMTLKDEFGFGNKRLERFQERFKTKTDCLAENYLTWQDMVDTIQKENGIDLPIWDRGQAADK